jgi:hypothetical protein
MAVYSKGRHGMEEHKLSILIRLSRGEISLMEATDELGFQDAGYTLQALAKAGLKPFTLPDDIVKQQADDALEALRAALRKR